MACINCVLEGVHVQTRCVIVVRASQGTCITPFSISHANYKASAAFDQVLRRVRKIGLLSYRNNIYTDTCLKVCVVYTALRKMPVYTRVFHDRYKEIDKKHKKCIMQTKT